MIPIITKYPDYCRSCNKDVPVGTGAWWAPGEGILHEECCGRNIDGRLSESHKKRLREAFMSAEVPEKYVYDIDTSKQRIEALRKSMHWPEEYN